MTHKGGRPPKPPAERRSETVRSRVPADVYDAICARAARERKSISALVGDVLAQSFRSKTFQTDHQLS